MPDDIAETAYLETPATNELQLARSP